MSKLKTTSTERHATTSFSENDWCQKSAYPDGIIDLHLCQQLSINAEVAEASPLVVDDAVALAGHRDEPGTLIVVWPLQSSQQVPCDGVN